MSISRWWMCSLSACAIPIPLRILRTIASTTSSSGTARTSSGMAIGIAIAARSPPLGPSRFWPTPEIVATAISIPSRSAPESPMKIFAG